jgi:hypothetical protein
MFRHKGNRRDDKEEQPLKQRVDDRDYAQLEIIWRRLRPITLQDMGQIRGLSTAY